MLGWSSGSVDQTVGVPVGSIVKIVPPESATKSVVPMKSSPFGKFIEGALLKSVGAPPSAGNR